MFSDLYLGLFRCFLSTVVDDVGWKMGRLMSGQLFDGSDRLLGAVSAAPGLCESTGCKTAVNLFTYTGPMIHYNECTHSKHVP